MRAIALVLACLTSASLARRLQTNAAEVTSVPEDLLKLEYYAGAAAQALPNAHASAKPRGCAPGHGVSMAAGVADALSRRSALLLGAATLSSLPVAAHAAGDKGKVVIFGGSGYVGAYASQILLAQGYEVVSVSRKSPSEQAEKVKSILTSSLTIDYQQLDALSSDLSGVLKGADAVISCIGIAPGGANQKDGNGLVNVKIADAVKAAGINKFVYLGVASELSNGPIKFVFGDYVKGKAEAEAAVAKDFGSAALIIKPGIIAGAPPGEIRPPGPPGMTAVPVEAVARVAVAGALGQKSGKIDGNSAIIAAAGA